MPRITLLFACLHALFYLALVARVIGHRRARRIGLGDGGDDTLARKIRVHGNFVEYVPFALLLLALLELSGLRAAWLWGFGIALLVGRVLHAFGLTGSPGVSHGRFWGTVLTLLSILGMALAGLWIWAANAWVASRF